VSRNLVAAGHELISISTVCVSPGDLAARTCVIACSVSFCTFSEGGGFSGVVGPVVVFAIVVVVLAGIFSVGGGFSGVVVVVVVVVPVVVVPVVVFAVGSGTSHFLLLFLIYSFS